MKNGKIANCIWIIFSVLLYFWAAGYFFGDLIKEYGKSYGLLGIAYLVTLFIIFPLDEKARARKERLMMWIKKRLL